MSAALDMIQQAGITVEVKYGGKLVLRGLASLPKDKARDIIAMAKANKDQIVADIADVCPYTDDQLAAYAQRSPHLVCCPETKPKWWWRYRDECGKCQTNQTCRHWKKGVAVPRLGEGREQPSVDA